MDEDVEQRCPTFCLSEHAGFQGSIKNCARDFIVIEIDVQGNQVIQTGTATGTPPGTVEPDGADVLQVREGSERVTPQKEGPPEDLLTPDVSCWSEQDSDLGLLLDPDVYQNLEKFTSQIRACTKLQQETEVSLGLFPDKQLRGHVHRAVKRTYPFLLTITKNTEICVQEDPDFKELSGLVSWEESEEFFRFKDEKVPGSTFSFLPDPSKEHRTSVHHLLSRRFGKLVETKSFVVRTGTAITVRLRERRGRKRGAESDHQNPEIYTAFTLRKENLETLDAISFMAAALGILPSDFSYAGIKDKRAVTYQTMVVKKISPNRLMENRPEFEEKGLRLSNIRPASEPLHLGRLKGNHFNLVVRHLRPHGNHGSADLRALVEEAVENVKVRGFVNYYGPQRFGNHSVPADRVGLALLKDDVITAIRLFLSPENEDDLENKAKQHYLHTGNAKESLALMPTWKARERLMLRALHRYGAAEDGCTRAWLSLPHKMRLFYVHAYCSRVWNHAVRVRLQKLPHRPVQGDLVWTREPGTSEVSWVHVVTAEEENSGTFVLDQLVLPMPGNSVRYPENLLGQWYRDRLARDDLASCRFRTSSLKLNVPGCYRSVLSHPHNLSYSLRPEGEHPKHPAEPESQSSTVLELSFDLDSSCYATVCLAEIMKSDL